MSYAYKGNTPHTETVTALQPGVKQCKTCPNLTRPYKTRIADYPGTIVRGVGGSCSTCNSRERAEHKRLNPPADKTPGNIAALNGYMTARRNRLRKTVNT